MLLGNVMNFQLHTVIKKGSAKRAHEILFGLMFVAALIAPLCLKMLIDRVMAQASAVLPLAGLMLCGIVYVFFLLAICLS